MPVSLSRLFIRHPDFRIVLLFGLFFFFVTVVLNKKYTPLVIVSPLFNAITLLHYSLVSTSIEIAGFFCQLNKL